MNGWDLTEFRLEHGPFDGVTITSPSILRVVVLQDLESANTFHRYEWVPGYQIGREDAATPLGYRDYYRLNYMSASDQP